jgi:hypothetical protein
MSHIAKCELDVISLDDLAVACEAMGLTYEREATAWKSWYADNPNWKETERYQEVIGRERFGTSDAGVIRVPGANYDIGVYKLPGQPGKHCLIYDQFSDGGGIEKTCGAGLVALKERYGAVVATKQLKKRGFAVREERHPATNRLRLVATRSKF